MQRRASLATVISVVVLGSAGTGIASASACDRADAELGMASPGATAGATLCLINAERRARGLRRVGLNRLLTSAAQRHSRDMVRRRYFAHEEPGGRGPLERIRSTGYLRAARSWRLAENLGWGTTGKSSPTAMVRAWMESPKHRRAMLEPSYRDVGIGVFEGVPGAPVSGGTYTVDFAVRR
jgi:uncharacterized protein YkwD